MSPRAFTGLVGAVALIVGLAFMMMTVTLDAGSIGGGQISCGSAFELDLGAARHEDQVNEIGRTLTGGEAMFDETDHAADCRSAVTTRRVWSIPLAVLGAVMLLGAIVVRQRRDG